MGMYTELLLKCRINEGIDYRAEEVLRHLFSGDERPATLPDHPLFRLPRWGHIGSGSSFYHHPASHSDLTTGFSEGHTLAKDGGYLFSRSDFKNYNEEISAFLNWLHPYLDAMPGQCVGWVWYEEWDLPQLLIYEATGIESKDPAVA